MADYFSRTKFKSGYQEWNVAVTCLYDLFKNVKDYLTPYKSNYYINRDLSQPVIAIQKLKHALDLLAKLIISPYLIVENQRLTFSQKLLEFIAIPLISSFIHALQGMFLLATTIFLLIKIPLRGLITIFNRGFQLIEQDKGLNVLLERARSDVRMSNTSQCYWSSMHCIHTKLKKAIDRSRESKVINVRDASDYFTMNVEIASPCVVHTEQYHSATFGKLQHYLTFFTAHNSKNSASNQTEHYSI